MNAIHNLRSESRSLSIDKNIMRMVAEFRNLKIDGKNGIDNAFVTLFQASQNVLLNILTPKNNALQVLKENWEEWFLGTDFQKAIPERIDKWDVLWIKVMNPILLQKLQFKTDVLLKSICTLLRMKIKEIRWKL